MCCDANVRRGKCLRCQGDADAPRGSSGPKPTPFQQHQQRSAGSQASRQRRPNDLGAEVLADIADGLNADQVRALNLALGGESMLLTGGAGTGKSFTLARLIRGLHARHGVEAVFVTGSTGIAGCHVGGTTLHSFAGIGLGKESASELIRRIKGSRASRERWHACAVLVVSRARTWPNAHRPRSRARPARSRSPPARPCQRVPYPCTWAWAYLVHQSPARRVPRRWTR
jgi:hypothetical protein